MKVLGVDPGTATTGYGIVEMTDGAFRCVTFGAIRQPRGASYPAALRNLHEQLCEVIRYCQVDGVAVEELFYAVNVKSALKLAQTRGVILLVASQHDLPVFEYSPLEVKKGIVGYGRAEKIQMQGMVQRLLKLDCVPKPHDAADALALALCHLYRSGFNSRARSACK
ncbi:MAG: crossover junction endodeoxyribonuclease RuvC [Acidobacteriota bacterium]